ncbi:2-amino-4-hydroxy-6-hydroxymethyldihydropteridine diphosphokinase [Ideonella livida]|uniref:2-amino-4-hydroxy-6-hydroxymethyldihydropteridine pyrophosphokinase n=1 Tax=Ideonella livida TaxID=2707176 RepID=A0A7C9TKF0_9BURK|nr:2-amino-4-hydroxy-6-hydroxymethyldihydropteridine diphosphokinase [Ideonella livida]NDY91704.1 2-amino-4-hydroxy-6-hydroxymethyldihydropteridine diphosphokinase [Ideonella livida]
MTAAAPEVQPAWIGLGANLGDARATLEAALQALRRLPGVDQLQASAFYRTAPVGAGGPDYLNAVARIRTTLPSLALLHALQRIELDHGRERPYPNAPRTLDLDLLMHGQQVLNTVELTLPHPRLAERAFVLVPLLSLDPTLQAPGLGRLDAYLPAVADQNILCLA